MTQLAGHPTFKELNKATQKYGHNQVNDSRILVKLTEKDAAPWQFTFQPDDLATLRADESGGFKTFAVLVWGTATICLLPVEDLSTVIDLHAASARWVRVELTPGSRMRGRGGAGELRRAVANNAFPDGVFS